MADTRPDPTGRAAYRPNVLFVCFDDLSDWISVLGPPDQAHPPAHPRAHTPHFERLARRAVTFETACCAAPLCNPSRAAMMTGLHPSSSGVYFNNQRHWSGDHWTAGLASMPDHFVRHGYRAVNFGKVFHLNPRGLPEGATERVTGPFDVYVPERGERPRLREAAEAAKEPVCTLGEGFSWAWGPLPDDWDREDESKMQADTKNARRMAGFLREDHDGPFWAQLGISRPHLMYYAPQRFYDLYPREQIKPPPGWLEDDLDEVAPVHAMMRRAEADRRLRESGLWRDAIRGYLACISYADEQLGRVLDALETGPHGENTIVVVTSDHGYHNMEKHHWTKGVLWERSVRVPLLISLPRSGPDAGTAGSRVTAPASLVDLYPTLLGLSGLEGPDHDLDGRDLAPLWRDSAAGTERVAITTHGRGNHSVRSARYRYIRFRNGEQELYDLERDPWEWHNLAGDPAHADTCAALRAKLPATNAPDAPYFSYLEHEAAEQYGDQHIDPRLFERLGPPAETPEPPP